MKKMLISDYDNTLNINGVSDRDLQMIDKFVSLGNIFVVSSSRTWPSLNSEMEKYGVPFNYLCCANANAIYDNSGKPIYVNYLNSEEKILIESLREKLEKMIGFDELGIKSNDDVLYYHLILSAGDDFGKKVLPYLLETKLESDYYANVGQVFSSRIQKDFAGTFLGQQLLIPIEQIYTIGDGRNDLSMIAAYNGYTLPWGIVKLKNVALSEVLSVGELLQQIINDDGPVRKREK